MFPDFQEDWIHAFLVQRARIVEPLRPIGTTDEIPPIRTSVQNFYMANTAMVYPSLNNGESVTQLARKVVDALVTDLETRH
jgi:hypothetical protein